MGIFYDAGKKLSYMRKFSAKGMSHLNLQILYDCTFKCKICDFWKKPYNQYPRLSLEKVRVIDEKIAPLSPLVISMGGGEPLLHDDLVPIARTLAKRNFMVMISNGWFMTDTIARELWQAGLYEASISIDYADPSRHDKQRSAPGSFDRAVNALELLQKRRVHPHQRVNLITVVMDDNLDDIEPLIKLASSVGVTYLVTLYSGYRGTKARNGFDRDIGKYLLSIKKKYRHFVAMRGYLERFSEAVSPGGISPCYAGRNLFNIDSQGYVTVCIDRLENRAGNILEDDLGELLERLDKIRQEKPCSSCWTSCRGPVETLMYGKRNMLNYLDYYRMTRDVRINRAF